MNTIYWISANQAGTVLRESAVPKGAEIVDQQRYEARLAEFAAVQKVQRDVRKAERQALADADFAALIGAGIPEATARRLTGGRP